MSNASGLGVLDLAILEACERAGARNDGPYVKTQRVLETLTDSTGIGPRHAYEPLCDLARSWVVHLPLIDFHGNSGSPDFAPASPRYTECRLTPLGAGVLAAERGAIGPLPIGLINGSTHAGGVRPPLDPINVVRAIRLASTATDDEIVELVGLPAFSTGCNVDGDLEAFAAGEVTELHLSARVSEAGPFRIVISNLPPGSAVGEIANRIAARVHPERPVPNDPGLATTSVVRPDEPSPITDVNDRTTTPGATNLVVSVAPHSNVSAAIAVLDGIWGIERSLTVQLERPLATAIRAFAASADADANLERRLTMIETALTT